jgi:hypothetical protein
MKEYKHTQVGYVLIVALGAAILFIARLTLITRFNPGTMFLLGFMILCLALFATLTVQVSSQTVNIRFGIGVIRRHFALRDVQAFRAVKNPWYYAWGIHMIPNGWVFNVSGWEAVELQMKDGRKYRIGTDDTRGLMAAVEASLNPRKP